MNNVINFPVANRACSSDKQSDQRFSGAKILLFTGVYYEYHNRYGEVESMQRDKNFLNENGFPSQKVFS